MEYGIIAIAYAFSFNPLNRGGVIYTNMPSWPIGIEVKRFNPLNRGGVIHTRSLRYHGI